MLNNCSPDTRWDFLKISGLDGLIQGRCVLMNVKIKIERVS